MSPELWPFTIVLLCLCSSPSRPPCSFVPPFIHSLTHSLTPPSNQTPLCSPFNQTPLCRRLSCISWANPFNHQASLVLTCNRHGTAEVISEGIMAKWVMDGKGQTITFWKRGTHLPGTLMLAKCWDRLHSS